MVSMRRSGMGGSYYMCNRIDLYIREYILFPVYARICSLDSIDGHGSHHHRDTSIFCVHIHAHRDVYYPRGDHINRCRVYRHMRPQFTSPGIRNSQTDAFPPLLQYFGADGAGQMSHFVKDDGYNTFRLPVAWQFLTNYVLGAPIDADNMVKYDALVQACLVTGAFCIIDIHNYARWEEGIIGQGGPTNEQFAATWGGIAAIYKDTPNIIFGIMNEPHDIPDINLWAGSVQAAVTAIRNAGATTQMILLPGDNWTSAQTFVSNGSADALKKVVNPDGSVTNLLFDVHKYLDSDNSNDVGC
ncbi:glycoside hydrolase superfamily [Mycena rosella]|uniref:cellulase n=1 Tax=Mycena rosella TaxID=1033263 RepID=A0AAD7DSV8_MYCRO|nr:glycoside hydrolase superfamily [Mycena rosella]